MAQEKRRGGDQPAVETDKLNNTAIPSFARQRVSNLGSHKVNQSMVEWLIGATREIWLPPSEVFLNSRILRTIHKGKAL